MDSTGGSWRTQVSDHTPAPSPAAKLQTGVMRILPLGKGSGEHRAGDDHLTSLKQVQSSKMVTAQAFECG